MMTKVPMCCRVPMWKAAYDYMCLKCGSRCNPASIPQTPSCCGRTMYELRACYLCGGVDKDLRVRARENEGWTSTLAKLIGPCSPPTCKYEYAHAPDTTCDNCDYPLLNFRSAATTPSV